MCEDVVPGSDGDVRMVFVKSGLVNARFCRSLDDCDGTRNVLRGWLTKKCALRKQRARAGREFEAQKMLLNGLVLIRKKSDEKEKFRVRKCFCCVDA